ncbi:hypothetical protein DPMN_009615 [Dreissena polymorpha]|uniref:Uncharacterized protein n=1 Tax=Dreissena polymorpha TaxID=45954 RepID=A0A9D4MYD9_DREPO|nr:hypothetical protein DPMN_009615 [Dreissena polymorpha]
MSHPSFQFYNNRPRRNSSSFLDHSLNRMSTTDNTFHTLWKCFGLRIKLGSHCRSDHLDQARPRSRVMWSEARSGSEDRVDREAIVHLISRVVFYQQEVEKKSCIPFLVELGRVWSGNFGDRDDRVDRIGSGNPPLWSQKELYGHSSTRLDG